VTPRFHAKKLEDKKLMKNIEKKITNSFNFALVKGLEKNLLIFGTYTAVTKLTSPPTR